MLRIEGLEVVRDRFRIRVESLVSGNVTVLLGRNGAGKTTLLKAVAGFIKPLRGVIMLDGRDITYAPPDRRGVGYMPQEPVKLPFKPRQAVDYFAKLFNADSQPLIERMNIQHLLRKNTLSLGENQVLTLAVLMLRRPRLLLLDEPTSNLDFLNRLNFWRIVKSLDTPMLYVTHDPLEAAVIADEIYLIEDGVVKGPHQNNLKHRSAQLIEELNIYKQLGTTHT